MGFRDYSGECMPCPDGHPWDSEADKCINSEVPETVAVDVFGYWCSPTYIADPDTGLCRATVSIDYGVRHGDGGKDGSEDEEAAEAAVGSDVAPAAPAANFADIFGSNGDLAPAANISDIAAIFGGEDGGEDEGEDGGEDEGEDEGKDEGEDEEAGEEIAVAADLAHAAPSASSLFFGR